VSPSRRLKPNIGLELNVCPLRNLNVFACGLKHGESNMQISAAFRCERASSERVRSERVNAVVTLWTCVRELSGSNFWLSGATVYCFS
jgi:hypothetical protein